MNFRPRCESLENRENPTPIGPEVLDVIAPIRDPIPLNVQLEMIANAAAAATIDLIDTIAPL